ncbi:MAG: hypothetical protein M0P12_03360 [Paludibacteraceae bacterium]|jgi:hypothetical protein|nr:hypothetical protein [Paludibacteraceae bacterium]MCK9615999.1 hypothetical protein [Candidatus Omnitrophota bacterium]
MKVDYVAFIQGAHDARDKGDLSQESHFLVQDTLYPFKKTSECGRTYIEYEDLLIALSKINLDWLEAARLWGFLGRSMFSGIFVGRNL